MLKLETVFIAVFGLGLLLGVAFLVVKNNISSQPNIRNQVNDVEYEEQVSEQGDVVLKVNPLSLQAGSEAEFKLNMDTHSVELDYDLIKQSSLVDDQGRILKPISWNGGSGGHHLSGELIFPDPGKVKTLELRILGLDGIDRKFKWEISKPLSDDK